MPEIDAERVMWQAQGTYDAHGRPRIPLSGPDDRATDAKVVGAYAEWTAHMKRLMRGNPTSAVLPSA